MFDGFYKERSIHQEVCCRSKLKHGGMIFGDENTTKVPIGDFIKTQIIALDPITIHIRHSLSPR